MSLVADQLSLATGGASRDEALALSGSREIEAGARAMLLLAEGLFRLDVALTGDSLRTVVRNLSPGELQIEEGQHGEAQAHLVFGEAVDYQPAHGRVRFSLGEGEDTVSVSAIIGVVRFAERGTVRVSAQALIQRAPVS